LTTDAGGSFFVPQMVGRARALGMLLLGEGVSAITAQQWGLIWKAVPDDKLSDAAKGIAFRLAHGPTEALRAIKSGINVSDGHSLEQQLEHEQRAQHTLEQTENYLEGFSAFLEKRNPRFK
ncbi:MAG: 2-(1,2-epoxy-1,2-dihydrophenyl)acetyl-CoA isomerase, partial [Fimbriimonadaceae bacterium]|nr:2-(1,2-epoxy-1,2-dihydrophenyl)acetyl-CoA isomerase [Alphaproteobacteria bacterium]